MHVAIKAFCASVSAMLAVACIVHVARLQHVHGQAQVSNQPQARLAATAVAIGQVMGSALCPGGVSTTELCVQPSTGTTGAAGVALQSGVSGDRIQVMMTGVVECVFDNTPVLNDLAYNNVGFCHDSGVTLLSQAPDTQGVVGKITGSIDSTHAWVTMYHPGSVGDLVTANSLDPSTVPAYVKSNQTAQINSDWNATSGLSQVLNKPALAAVATSGSYADLSSKPSIPQFFNTAGSLTGIKCFQDSVASTATTGAYSFNMTSAGFTSAPVVQLTVKSTATGAAGQNFASPTTVTSTTASGIVYSPTVLLVLGATAVPQATSTTVWIRACGT